MRIKVQFDLRAGAVAVQLFGRAAIISPLQGLVRRRMRSVAGTNMFGAAIISPCRILRASTGAQSRFNYSDRFHWRVGLNCKNCDKKMTFIVRVMRCSVIISLDRKLYFLSKSLFYEFIQG